MKNTNFSEKTETLFGQIFKPIPVFLSGIILGSIATVYGTLTHVDLLNYLESNNRDILEFYGDLFGLSQDYLKPQPKFQGYIEKINITVNPKTLKLYGLPNSICEAAIIEGDQLLVPQSKPEENLKNRDKFSAFKEQVEQIINDGVGSLEVLSINEEPASIEINLLTEEPSCIRKPQEIKQLEKLLEEKKWKEADLKTYNILLKEANRKADGDLNRESIENFPCHYLKTIDQLWQRYSGGKFGFIVQKKIYKKTGNNLQEDYLRKYDPDAYIQFNDLVRWIETGADGKESWRPYDKLTFSLDAPEGHLPRLEKLAQGMEKEPSYKMISPNSLPLSTQEIQARNLLFSRIDNCGV